MGTVRILLVLVLLFVTSHLVAAPKVAVRPEPTTSVPAPVVLTEAQVRAAIAANDKLSIELSDKLKDAQSVVTSQAATLKTVQAKEADTASKNADLNQQVGTLNHTITTLKEENFWDKWKYSILGLGLGIVAAVVSFFVAKMMGYVAVTGATVAAKIP